MNKHKESAHSSAWDIRKDSSSVSGHYYGAGACSLDTLVELVLPAARTLLRTQSLLQLKADGTGSV